jgi:hypothetical protein
LALQREVALHDRALQQGRDPHRIIRELARMRGIYSQAGRDYIGDLDRRISPVRFPPPPGRAGARRSHTKTRQRRTLGRGDAVNQGRVCLLKPNRGCT